MITDKTFERRPKNRAQTETLVLGGFTKLILIIKGYTAYKVD